ncbi:MAG: DUF4837 family protein [Bacteroidales bacterium]|jgi:hypothetical protein|nr:DUF4837 family protein [Bacteroidales bacterium]
MKMFGKIVVAVTTVALMAGCTGKKDDTVGGKPSSGGKTLEVMLVVPDDVYRGELRDTINYYFGKECEGLNQPEPIFDVVQLNPAGFYKSEMFQKHRNIIIINLKDTNQNKLYQYTDYKASPQNYFEFSVNNRDSLYSFIRRSADMIIKKFYDNEFKRIGNAFKKLENIKATEAIKKHFGFTLVVSEDFYVATQTDNFMWIRKETSDVSWGLMIYKTAFNESLLAEDKIVAIRNKITKEHIPGPSRGNFMGIESRVPLIRKNVTLDNNVAAIETRGLWRMLYEPNVKITAFMGGAFVNYCFADKDQQNLIMIDGFVQSPKLSKRDQLIQLEAIVRNIKF